MLDELRHEVPEADVLVVDDGSTDRTAEVAREHGAEVLSFGENAASRGIAAGYGWADEHGYACGRVDADGQHPAAELKRLLELVRSGEADVAVGSRFVSGPGYEPYRYEPEGSDGWAPRCCAAACASRSAARSTTPPAVSTRPTRRRCCCAQPYESGAPEVEAPTSPGQAGLRMAEVPVDMRARASGESKLQGKKALVLVLTVIATLFGARRLWRHG